MNRLNFFHLRFHGQGVKATIRHKETFLNVLLVCVNTQQPVVLFFSLIGRGGGPENAVVGRECFGKICQCPWPAAEASAVN